jgi:hypothetical protein
VDLTPQDLSEDLGPLFHQFCADDEMQAKRELIAFAIEYYESTTCDNYREKWDKGAVEHGPFTREKLYRVDWMDQGIQELKDGFYYWEKRRFKLFLEGKLAPGDPFPRPNEA